MVAYIGPSMLQIDELKKVCVITTFPFLFCGIIYSIISSLTKIHENILHLLST
jgi:hypothetical protein